MAFDVDQIDAVLSTTRAVRLRLDLEREVPDEIITQCIDLAGASAFRRQYRQPPLAGHSRPGGQGQDCQSVPRGWRREDHPGGRATPR